MEVEILSKTSLSRFFWFIVNHYYFIWHAEFDDYWIKEVKLIEGESLPRWRSLGYPREDHTPKMSLDDLDAIIEYLLEEKNE